MSSSSSAAISNGTIHRTKILFLGMRRSGKTSILQVHFDDLPVKQTFYLEPTMRVAKHFIDIFVIDIQDLHQHPVSKLVECIVAACQINPDINFEVFVRKAERLQEDYKIHERVMDRLIDESPKSEQFPSNFPLTPYINILSERRSLALSYPTQIHVATDTSPVDQATHNLCCDYLYMLNSFGPLYRYVHIINFPHTLKPSHQVQL
ncbi:hypothetical protein BDR03DRAFT_949993 [Suillus americanus]|nr:hypothetical protein BDR03DRAFT_949993 [Suillus americanus]